MPNISLSADTLLFCYLCTQIHSYSSLATARNINTDLRQQRKHKHEAFNQYEVS